MLTPPLYFNVEIPKPPHPGAFGAVRKFHRHEGVDLYAPEGSVVCAMETGVVVAIQPFTGPRAGSPWWNNTMCVMIEGASGVINYGEITPFFEREIGAIVEIHNVIGIVKTVLKKDKGRPMSMLHIELYDAGVKEPVEWKIDAPQPVGLRDITPLLESAFTKP